ncbi:type II secretion system F family protein [Roseiconus lacunae]|uniref:type II secretion system F family protein n=1 Tax=Roseiconus lacunae TaxID=2605694 RepID=UPI0011F3CDF2|nr:type II secretion system F family protein [Roseiconus lacunae]
MSAIKDSDNRQVLYDRIETVRQSDQHWNRNLQSVADAIPDPAVRGHLNRLIRMGKENFSPQTLVAQFPDLFWLLTLRSDRASADATTIILEQSAYQSAANRRRLQTLAYPIVVATMAMLLAIAISYFVVPPFDEMFREFELRVPSPTKIVLGFSSIVTSHPLVALLFVVLVVALCWLSTMAITHGIFARNWFRFGDRGKGLARSELARLAVQLAELVDEGIPISTALRIASACTQQHHLFSLLVDTAKHIERSRNNAMESNIDRWQDQTKSGLPANFQLAIGMAAGTDTATSDTTLLRSLSNNYQELSVSQSSLLSIVISILTLIGIAMMVAFVVFALFLPMISLVTVLSS